MLRSTDELRQFMAHHIYSPVRGRRAALWRGA
jgi:hypothetical protein